MDTLQVHSLLNRSLTYALTLDTSQPLGSGVQGRVYPLVGTDRVVKLYTSAAARRHVVPFVRHLQAGHLAAACPSLQGLPLDVFVTGDGAVGIVMQRVAGASIGGDGYRPLHGLSLSQRMAMAHALAEGVARLHAHGVVLADLAESNLLLDTTRSRAYLIDVDGGGIVNGRRYRLKPLVWGHDRGSLMPLEIRQRRAPPTLASDDWSLAVLLHRLLSQPPGADPFFYGRDHRVVAEDGLWPPPVAPAPAALQPLLVRHRAGLARLGARLTAAFQHTFGPLGRQYPEQRVPAERWLHSLELAQDWLHVCGSCGSEFVAEQMRHCPACGALVPHAFLTADRWHLPIQQARYTVTERRLGLGHARQKVMCWERHHERVAVQVLAGTLTVGQGKRMRRVEAGEHYRLQPGDHVCQLQVNPQAAAHFHLINPEGPWSRPPTAPVRPRG